MIPPKKGRDMKNLAYSAQLKPLPYVKDFADRRNHIYFQAPDGRLWKFITQNGLLIIEVEYDTGY